MKCQRQECVAAAAEIRNLERRIAVALEQNRLAILRARKLRHTLQYFHEDTDRITGDRKP